MQNSLYVTGSWASGATAFLFLNVLHKILIIMCKNQLKDLILVFNFS